MKRLAALFAFLSMLLLPSMVAAQHIAGTRTVVTTSWIEEWDPASQSWVRVPGSETTQQEIRAASAITEAATQIPHVEHVAVRYAQPVPPAERVEAIAEYGSFRVIDAERAALVGSTSANSPANFDAMLRDFPELEVLEMIEAPGTSNDIANLELGRRIRSAGLRTHVPHDGSVRSGAVELFLAGAEQSMDAGAQFAVHSWLDNYGREPDDFAADAPENRLYLDYYVEMGMSEDRARDFYAMTNSVPHADALWLQADDMAPWIAPEGAFDAEIRMAKLNWLSEPVRALPIPTLELSAQPVMLASLVKRPENYDAPTIAYADLSKFELPGSAHSWAWHS